MRKIIPILSMLFMFTYSLLGQTITVSLPDTAAIKASDVLIPVKISAPLDSVSSVTIRIAYNSDAVDFVSIENNNLVGGSFVSNTVGDSLLLVSWTNLADPVDLITSIFDIKFAYKKGTSELKFIDGQNEVVGKTPVTFVNGKIVPLPVQISLSKEVGAVGDTIIVELSGTQLEDIGAMSLFIDYSEVSAEFIGLGDVNLPNFTSGTSTNTVNLGMVNSDGFNHASGVMATLLFEVVDASTDLTFKANSIVQTTDYTFVTVAYTDGKVSLIDGTFALGHVIAKADENVSVPFYAFDAVNIGSFNIAITYDNTVLEFVQVDELDGLTANDKDGVLLLGYINYDGLTADGKIAELVFNVIEGESVLSFVQSSANITDVDYKVLNYDLVNGSVKEDTSPYFTVFPDGEIMNIDENNHLPTIENFEFLYEGEDPEGLDIVFGLQEVLQGNDYAYITIDADGNLVIDPDEEAMVDQGNFVFEIVASLTNGEIIVLDTSIVTYDKTVDVENPDLIPTVYSLEQNYPNPFNPTSTIRFGLPAQSTVNITVYNMLGQEVITLADSELAAGVHTVTFNAVSLSSGIYFYSIKASALDGSKEFSSVKKMMLMK